MVGIVSAVGNQTAYRTDPLQQGPCDADVVDVAGRQQQGTRSALPVGQRVEFARLATARLAERLEIGPPFPPPAERCALIWLLSIIARPWIGLCPVKTSKISSQRPCRLQRLKRL